MRVLRIYTGDDNESHFEELEVPLHATRYGSLSDQVAVKGVMFRETPVGGSIDFHNAPQRQFVVNLSGRVEIETGDGTKRQLGAGDILLADDTTGHGHITRDIEGPRHSLFLPLAEDVDLSGWRK
jgi:quercetin dioxygenase-like cupin family protein